MIEKVTRKRRAIMSADVKGYSILMADDEVATNNTLPKKDSSGFSSHCLLLWQL